MQLTRKESWPAILAEQIKAAEMRPFSFGEHDCLLFVANVAHAMTDADPAAEIRGSYNDEWIIRRFGSVRNLATHCFGEPIHQNFAQRGDIVLIERGGRESLAVCTGARACGPGAKGLEWAQMSEAICAWKV